MHYTKTLDGNFSALSLRQYSRRMRLYNFAYKVGQRRPAVLIFFAIGSLAVVIVATEDNSVIPQFV
jgi:hypothetical protein